MEREEELRDLLKRDGLWPDASFRDTMSGVLWLTAGGFATLGVDWGINGEWQVVLYWSADDESEMHHFSAVDLSADGLDLPRDASPEVAARQLRPLVRALFGEESR